MKPGMDYLARAVLCASLCFSCIWMYTAAAQEEFAVSRCVGEKVEVSCPPAGCTIQVISALNHHQLNPSRTCNTSHVSPTCYSNATDVWGRCHRRTTCSLFVLQERPGRNCSSVSQFTTLRYRCKCPERCEKFTALPRGEISYSYTYIGEGTEATHSCNAGYHLVGPAVRMCEAAGKWNGIRPACSVPVSRCPASDFSMQTYGDRCYELSSVGESWEDSIHYCKRSNGTLARISSRNELAFILWWLHQSEVYKYIWIDLEPLSELRNTRDVKYEPETNGTTTPGGITLEASSTVATVNLSQLLSLTTAATTTTTNQDVEVLLNPSTTYIPLLLPTGCYELYRNDSAPGGWLTRRSNCRFKSQFICEYESIVEKNFFAEADSKIKHMAISVGIGLGVAFVLIGACVCLFTVKPWKSREPIGDTYDTVLDPHDERRDADDRQEDMTYENGLTNDAFEGDPEKASKSDEGLYDDVYYGNMASTAPSRDARPAKIARKPIRKALGALNPYENVVVHNLTESLKRKLRPRMFRKESAKKIPESKECECIQEEYANVSSVNQKRRAPPPPGQPKKPVRASDKNTCKACGGKTPKPQDTEKTTTTTTTTDESHEAPLGDDKIPEQEMSEGPHDETSPVVVHVNLNDVGHVNHRPADSARANAAADDLDSIMYRGTNRNPQMSTEI